MGDCAARPVPESYTMLMSGQPGAPNISSRRVLYALDPGRAHAVALSELASSAPSTLACAPGSDVFLSNPLRTVAPNTGVVTPIEASFEAGQLSSTIAYGGTPPRLFSVAQGLTTYDPSSGSITFAESATPPSRVGALALDHAGTGLYLTRGSVEGGGEASITPVDFEGRFGASLPFRPDAPASVELRGIAADTSSRLVYLAGKRRREPTENLHAYCRELSRALRFDMSSAPATGSFRYSGAEGAAESLTDDPITPTLVTYGSYSARRPGGTSVLTVETQHPESFVCITTNYEPVRVVVSATARFRYLVISSDDPSVELEIADGFVPTRTASPTIRVYARSGAAIPASEAVHVYPGEEWARLGLSTTGWDASSSSLGDPVLLSWDRATGAVFERPLRTDGTPLREVFGMCPWGSR
jgi:hypothetical protein